MCLSSSFLSLYNDIYAYDLKNNIIPLKKIHQHCCLVLEHVIFFSPENFILTFYQVAN